MPTDNSGGGDANAVVRPKSYAGIPEAEFVGDVDSYMGKPENVTAERVLKRLEEQHNKYKFMEFNLNSKKRRLKSQIPDLQKTVEMVALLEKQKDKNKDMETDFLLADQAYMRAVIPPTDKVCLWLGANVMLEYTLEDAKTLLKQNTSVAKTNLDMVNHDLDFLRDQLTTTEVNMARVFNWDVKRRQNTAVKAKN